MSNTAQPAGTPTAAEGGKPAKTSGASANNRRDFYVALGTMSWQLAVVVLVPIYLGSRLDIHFHSSPLWTLLGFVLAMIGTGLVVWRQLRRLTPPAKDGQA